MKNSKIRMIVPCVLAAIFLIAGFWMMAKSYGLVNSYNQQIQEAEQALAEADPAIADAVEQEAAALQNVDILPYTTQHAYAFPAFQCIRL